jgi:hypothetical protein
MDTVFIITTVSPPSEPRTTLAPSRDCTVWSSSLHQGNSQPIFRGNSIPLLKGAASVSRCSRWTFRKKPLFELAVKRNALAGASPKGLMEIRDDIGRPLGARRIGASTACTLADWVAMQKASQNTLKRKA